MSCSKAWNQQVVRIINAPSPAGSDKWVGFLARQELSNIANQSHDDVFHHQDGKNMQSRPSVRFRGGKHGFGVIQTAPNSELSGSIIDLMSNYALDNDCALSVNQIECSVSESEIKSYHGVFVCGKRNTSGKSKDGKKFFRDRSSFNKKMVSDIDFRHAELAKMIGKGMCHQFHEARKAELVGMAGHAYMGRISEHGHIDMESIQDIIDSITILKSDNMAPAKRSLPRFYIEFSMPFMLKGDWAAGSLTHQGYGHIISKGDYK